MKQIIILTLLSWRIMFNEVTVYADYHEAVNSELIGSEQSPFSFTNNVPGRIKINTPIDLSFYVNQSIVFQYRLIFEVPKGGESAVPKSLLSWSGWINKDINEIIIPKLGKEGKYKLVVEYKTHSSSVIKKYEKVFDVYIEGSTRPSDIAQSHPSIATKSSVTSIPPPIYENKTIPTQSVATQLNKEIETKDTVQTEKNLITKEIEINQKTELHLNEPTKESIVIPDIPEKKVLVDYDSILKESIENKNIVSLQESIENGAGKNFKGTYGGNVFHSLDERTASEVLISVLKIKGFSINESDNFGNTPLHYAILSGKISYAKSLINQGATLNIKNNMNLYPLHLAVLMNNKDVVEALLNKGTDVNIVGNTGYTPLHIASEMNHLEIARYLLKNGAKDKIKTDQKLTSKTISKIQKNPVMRKLIASNGSYTFSPSGSDMISGQFSKTAYPKIDFTLPYDKELIKKRQTARIIQAISIPVFVISAVGSIYLRSEADSYYSSYKDAETEETAKIYYNKTTQFDTYTYIAGGISLVSIYGFIHSTIRKKNVSSRMLKTF